METKERTMSQIIGEYCREYRINVMGMTLHDIEQKEQVKTLSSFEHGRSSNINHLIKYVVRCRTREEKIDFLQGLIEKLEGDNNG